MAQVAQQMQHSEEIQEEGAEEMEVSIVRMSLCRDEK
jgi:hypothetical protein